MRNHVHAMRSSPTRSRTGSCPACYQNDGSTKSLPIALICIAISVSTKARGGTRSKASWISYSTLDLSSSRLSVLSQTLDRPSFAPHGSSSRFDRPSSRLGVSSEKLDRPSSELHGSSSKLNTPRSKLDRPSSRLDTPSQTLDPPSSELHRLSSRLNRLSSKLDRLSSKRERWSFEDDRAPSRVNNSL